MTDWATQGELLRLALACAMLLSALLAPPSHSSHDPIALVLAEVERHAELAASGIGEEHSHEDGRPAERHAGQGHGHDPADHLPDIPAPADSSGHTLRDVGHLWHAAAPSPHHRGPSFGIERPPRA